MKTPIKEILKLVQDETDMEESVSLMADGPENTEEELSTSMKMLSFSAENAEEQKREAVQEKVYGYERLFLFTPEDTLKTIIEKIVASPDKRLLYIARGTAELKAVISITDIFTYVTK